MKATELRIGNWVYWNKKIDRKTPHKIVGIKEYSIMTIPISLGKSCDDYSPIPLTKEWLERFGFTGHALFAYEKHYLTLYRGDGTWWIETVKQMPILPVTYVHQLQNLYYSLTGEELVEVLHDKQKEL